MQTGYPHSPAGGACLPTSQDNSVRPLPAVYLPYERQITRVAAQPPGELRVTYDPSQYEQDHDQSQTFQDSRNFGISANVASLGQIADNTGQQRDFFKHSFGDHLRKSSELSNNTGPSSQGSTERMPVGVHKLNSDYEIRDYIKEKLAYIRINRNPGPALSSKGCPNDNDSLLQSHCNIPVSNNVACHPTSSTCDKEDVARQSLSCAVVEHCTTAAGQALEEDSSKASEASVELSPKSKNKSETSASETLSTGTVISEENAKHACFGVQVKKHLDRNDDKSVTSDDCKDKTFVSSSDNFQSKWCNRYTLNGITTLQYSLTALKELIASLENVKTNAKIDNFSEVILQQYWNGDIGNIHLFTSTEYPQIINEAAAICTKTEEESPVVLTAISGVTCEELTEKNPGLILNCSSSKEESKSVWVKADKDDGVPAVSLPLITITRKDREDKGLKPVEVNIVQGMINYSIDSRIIGDQDANINKPKNIGNQQHCPVTSKEAAAHSKLNSLVDKILINDTQSVTTNQSEQPVCDQTSCKSIRKDVSYVCSQVDLSTVLPDNKDAELTPLSGKVDKETHFVTILKEPQYEDISDAEDMSEVDTKLPEHEEFCLSLHLEDPEYEDISEDENPPIPNADVEMPSLPPDVSEPNVKPYGDVQVQMKPNLDEELISAKRVTPNAETASIAQHFSCPHFGETDDIECVPDDECDHARHSEWQTNRSCSPSSDLQDEGETDDEMDEYWDIIPLIISELKLELPEDRADPEDVTLDVIEHGDKVTQGGTSPRLCELHRTPPVQVPAPAFSEIEVFDTCESFQQAKVAQFGKVPQFPSQESLPVGDPKSHHSRRDSYSDPDDSCETDDSCNYSPVEEPNHLTVSKKLLDRLSAPASSETDDSESEEENVDDEVRNLQNDQTRSRQNTWKKEDDIIFISDTEDEYDQKCKNNAKRRKRFSLQNEVNAAAPCSPQTRDSSETVASVSESVEENLLKRGLLSSQSAKRTEKSGQLCENIAGLEHVQHGVRQQRVSDGESIIIIDSDTEDEDSQNYKKAKRKREFSSEWEGTGGDPCDKQETPVDTEYEAAKEKLQEREPSAGSPKPQHGSKCGDTHSKEEIQDTCSDLTRSMKRIQPPDAKTGSGGVQQNTNTQTTSKRFHESDNVVTTDSVVKKKAKTKTKRLSFETEDRNSAFVNTQNSPHVSNKPQKNGQSSKGSSDKQQQSGTDRAAASTVSRDPVIPHLSFQNFPESSGHLKCYKQSVAHGQDEDETPKKPTSISKNVNSCKTTTPLLYGDAQRKCISNPKPTSDRPLSKSKESSSLLKKISSSSRLQRPHSYNIPSTFINPYSPTKGPSAVTQVTNKWRESYFSTRKDKKTSVGMEEGLRPKNTHDLQKEAKPGCSHYDRAPRRRNSSQETTTPLMKRTMVEARELTKARNRDASREQTGYRVSDGYKWRK